MYQCIDKWHNKVVLNLLYDTKKQRRLKKNILRCHLYLYSTFQIWKQGREKRTLFILLRHSIQQFPLPLACFCIRTTACLALLLIWGRYYRGYYYCFYSAFAINFDKKQTSWGPFWCLSESVQLFSEMVETYQEMLNFNQEKK